MICSLYQSEPHLHEFLWGIRGLKSSSVHCNSPVFPASVDGRPTNPVPDLVTCLSFSWKILPFTSSPLPRVTELIRVIGLGRMRILEILSPGDYHIVKLTPRAGASDSIVLVVYLSISLNEPASQKKPWRTPATTFNSSTRASKPLHCQLPDEPYLGKQIVSPRATQAMCSVTFSLSPTEVSLAQSFLKQW